MVMGVRVRAVFLQPLYVRVLTIREPLLWNDTTRTRNSFCGSFFRAAVAMLFPLVHDPFAVHEDVDPDDACRAAVMEPERELAGVEAALGGR